MSQYLGDISAYALAVSQGYTGTEEEYAELMASYATVGQTAVTAAQTATTKASEAATAATTATNKASEATTAATTATNKAAEAQADADAAALDASQALSAASTATTKATEATTAAATAVSAKDDAVSANTAAQSAKTAAQTAQTGAETAAASVQSSAEQIATNAADISQLKSDLSEQTYNLVRGKKTGHSIGSNGKINANITTDMISAPVVSGLSYYISTDESSLICGFFSGDPFADGATSYNSSRIIQNSKVITAPINGYIAFRVLTGYAYPQIVEGSAQRDYIPPIQAYDRTARAKLTEVSIDYDYFLIHENKYANARNLILSDYTGMRALEFPVFGGVKFNYLFTVASVGAFGLYFEDSYGNTFGAVEAQTTTQVITVPDGAVRCYATINEKTQIAFINLANSLLSKHDTIYTSGLSATSTPLETLDDSTGMLDLFLHVGCIGDSLASGESYWNDGGTVQGQDFYQYSWGQFLARKTGNTYYNWSKGGLMAKTWLESEYATECFDGNHKCEAYIIGLGQNDRNHSVTIGTSADIDLTDYHNNADTFYGNYGKIIQKIKEIQPQAKIFVVTDPNPYVNRDGYNVPIADMATIFDNVYLIDMFTYGSKYYNNPIIQAQMRGSHYNAYGYKLYSMMIANYINWIITKNYTEFTQVELIGTGHSWTD